MRMNTPASSRVSAERQRQGLILAVTGAMAFSAKAIIVKLAYRYPGIDAITLLMYRMLFALPFFIGLSWWAGRGQAALSRRDWGIIFLLAFLGYYVASFADFLGLQYISAGLERLILYLCPTIVLLMGYCFFKQSIKRAQIMGMVVSYIGVLVVFAQELQFEGKNVSLGAALIFLSALSYAMYLVVSGKIVQRIGPMRLAGWATTIASVLCLAQFVLLRPMAAAAVPQPVLWLSLLNGVLCTVIPVTLTMLAIERVGASAVSQAGMIGPMSTIIMGILILDEPFSISLVIGTLLVLAGVYITNRR